MPNITSPFGERVYAQLQTGGLATMNNSGGVWSSTGAQYIRVVEDSLHMTPEEPKVAQNVKHGSASQLVRLFGRKGGQWSLNAPIAPSGTAAVAPDIDPLFQNAFGGPGALATGTVFGNAWQYSVVDRTSIPMTLLGFQHSLATTGNRYALGCITQRMTIDFNSNILGATFSGSCRAVVENESFSVLPDTQPLGGLGAYPTEPGSFSANGGLINSFGGTLTIGGQTFTDQCDNFSVEFNTGMAIKGNYIDDAYGAAIIYGMRTVTCNLGFVNDDSTQITQLKKWGRTNTPVNLQFALGTLAGYRMYVIVNGLQLVPATLTDANGYISLSMANSASSVSIGLSNDAVLGFA